MIKLTKAVRSRESPDFKDILKAEIRGLDPALLPLQAGLSQSSHVSDSGFDVVIINISDTAEAIRAKTGIMYAGIIAGSCCADDPSPVDEQPEYCEVQFDIDKATGEATASLVSD